MNKKRKRGIHSWRNRMKTPHSSLYALILTSCGKIPGFTPQSPNNRPTHKHTDTHKHTQTPRTRKHRQMRHDVCKPLSIKDNRAAINTDNWFQHPSYSLTRHFVSSPFTRSTEIKQTKHASMQIHTAKSKEDLLHTDTYSCSCTCFWQDNNQNLM